ncbi:HPP family protein [Sphingomonas aracearum]|uniref:HPP family protein n=1 Tax=Sphingomonas aracearum TaxID=2283317 RepID=A0A369VWH6_9SPHN|nr:HPP family protein [Sphingomonas aracearum]RDE06473.1 HPP family protein [Sphingomonas aracearum]
MRFALLLPGARWSDRLVACLGALLCLAATAALCRLVPLASADLPFLVAPLGASAVLVFAVPASPLAQPWSVVGGNTLSALVGVAVARIVPDAALAAGVAVGAAILVMSLLRCLHPPGGAAALTAVIGGPAIHAAGFAFAFWPVAVNSVLLVLLGIAFHRISGHSYPHRLAPAPGPRFAPSDIDAALAEMHESFDISREDLDALLARAEAHAARR